jgi:hypothetical protein
LGACVILSPGPKRVSGIAKILHKVKARGVLFIVNNLNFYLQTTILENAFYHGQYISKVNRLDITAATGLSNGQIRTWFQNRRMKV